MRQIVALRSQAEKLAGITPPPIGIMQAGVKQVIVCLIARPRGVTTPPRPHREEHFVENIGGSGWTRTPRYIYS